MQKNACCGKIVRSACFIYPKMRKVKPYVLIILEMKMSIDIFPPTYTL